MITTTDTDSLAALMKDIESRAKIIISENDSAQQLFNSLKTDLMKSYMTGDFRISVLKKYCAELLAVIKLSEI